MYMYTIYKLVCTERERERCRTMRRGYEKGIDV